MQEVTWIARCPLHCSYWPNGCLRARPSHDDWPILCDSPRNLRRGGSTDRWVARCVITGCSVIRALHRNRLDLLDQVTNASSPFRNKANTIQRGRPSIRCALAEMLCSAV
jgi:hypothetical protein